MRIVANAKLLYRRLSFGSPRGSALVQVMMTVAVLGLVALGIATLNNQMSTEERFTRQSNEEEGVAVIMRALISDVNICRQVLAFATNRSAPNVGGDPNPATMNVDPGQGMVMCIPPNGVTAAAALTPNPIRSLCPFTAPGEPGNANYINSFWFPDVAINNGAAYNATDKPYNSGLLLGTDPLYSSLRPSLNVDIREIRFLNNPAVQVNAAPITIYTGRLQALIQSNEPGARTKNWITIASQLKITVDATAVGGGGDNPIISCGDASSPAALCMEMGCSWDSAKDPKCVCGYASGSCPAGQALRGVDTSGNLICESIVSTCADGLVAVGYVNEQLVCEPPGQWFVDAWSPCVGNSHSRTVRCVHSSTGAEIDPSFCPTIDSAGLLPLDSGGIPPVGIGGC